MLLALLQLAIDPTAAIPRGRAAARSDSQEQPHHALQPAHTDVAHTDVVPDLILVTGAEGSGTSFTTLILGNCDDVLMVPSHLHSQHGLDPSALSERQQRRYGRIAGWRALVTRLDTAMQSLFEDSDSRPYSRLGVDALVNARPNRTQLITAAAAALRQMIAHAAAVRPLRYVVLHRSMPFGGDRRHTPFLEDLAPLIQLATGSQAAQAHALVVVREPAEAWLSHGERDDSAVFLARLERLLTQPRAARNFSVAVARYTRLLADPAAELRCVGTQLNFTDERLGTLLASPELGKPRPGKNGTYQADLKAARELWRSMAGQFPAYLHASNGSDPCIVAPLALSGSTDAAGNETTTLPAPEEAAHSQCAHQPWEPSQYGEQPNATMRPASMLDTRLKVVLPNFFTVHSAASYQPPEPREYHNAVPVFLHINKAGGTSIKQALTSKQAVAGWTKILNVDKLEGPFEYINVCGTENVAAILSPEGLNQSITPEWLERDLFLLGDYCMGMCELLAAAGRLAQGRRCGYFTMFRDPRERTISSYLYCQTDEGQGDQLCDTPLLDARTATFAEWVPHQANYMTRELLFDLRRDSLPPAEQWRRLSELTGNSSLATAFANKQGTDAPHPALLDLVQPNAQLTEARFSELLDTLENHFAVVGLLERYEESLELFDAAFDRNLSAAAGGNNWDHGSGRSSPGSEEGKDYKAALDKYMAAFDDDPSLLEPLRYDMRLYEHIQSVIFPRQVAAHRANKAGRSAASALKANATTAKATGALVAPGPIPRIIHHSWRDARPPEELEHFVGHWLRAHPGWTHLWWLDDDNRNLWQTHQPQLLPIYDGYGDESLLTDFTDRQPQGDDYTTYKDTEDGRQMLAEYNGAVVRADASRLLYMSIFGGVYGDLDTQPCANLEGLLAGHSLMIARSPVGFLSNFFIASAPGHAFWRFALPLLHETRHKVDVIEVAGPKFLDMAYERWSTLCSEPQRAAIEADCTGYETTKILDFDEYQELYGSHHWSGVWHCGPECQTADQEEVNTPGAVKITDGLQLGVRPQRNCLRVRNDGLTFVSLAEAGGWPVWKALQRLGLTTTPGRFERLVRIDDGTRGRASSSLDDEDSDETAACSVHTIAGPMVGVDGRKEATLLTHRLDPEADARSEPNITMPHIPSPYPHHTLSMPHITVTAEPLAARRPELLGPNSAAQLDALDSALQSFPVLLWVRDPVARLLACWRAATGAPDAEPTAEQRQVRARLRAALALETTDAVASRVELSDVQATLAAVQAAGGRQQGTWTPADALRRLLAEVPHAAHGLAWQVGGVDGLARTLAPQLLFVGTHERMAEDWRRFEAALSAHPLRAGARLDRSEVPREADAFAAAASVAAEEQRGSEPLAAAAVRLLREVVAEDFACLRALNASDWLPPTYLAAVEAREAYMLPTGSGGTRAPRVETFLLKLHQVGGTSVSKTLEGLCSSADAANEGCGISDTALALSEGANATTCEGSQGHRNHAGDDKCPNPLVNWVMNGALPARVRAVVVLRDPVERFFSQFYKHNFKVGVDGGTHFKVWPALAATMAGRTAPENMADATLLERAVRTLNASGWAQNDASPVIKEGVPNKHCLEYTTIFGGEVGQVRARLRLFSLVGLTEDMPRFLARLCVLYGWPHDSDMCAMRHERRDSQRPRDQPAWLRRQVATQLLPGSTAVYAEAATLACQPSPLDSAIPHWKVRKQHAAYCRTYDYPYSRLLLPADLPDDAVDRGHVNAAPACAPEVCEGFEKLGRCPDAASNGCTCMGCSFPTPTSAIALSEQGDGLSNSSNGAAGERGHGYGTVVFVHWGKCGGQALQKGLRDLAKSEPSPFYLVQVHGRHVHYPDYPDNATYQRTLGPASVALTHMAGAPPIVLWVRDPVDRFVSSWLARLESLDPSEFNGMASALARAGFSRGDFDELAADIPHAETSLAYYFFGDDLLNNGTFRRAPLSLDANPSWQPTRAQRQQLLRSVWRPRLLFVGRTDAYDEDWARLLRALGVAHQAPPTQTHHMARIRGDLHADALRVIREAYAEDYNLLRWLEGHTFLPTGYTDSTLAKEAGQYSRQAIADL